MGGFSPPEKGLACLKNIFREKVENSEALNIQNGQFEKNKRFRDSISPSSGPT
jgi:hypothetical protein